MTMRKNEFKEWTGACLNTKKTPIKHINQPKYHPTLGYMWEIGCVYCASLEAYYCEICKEYHCKDAPECGDGEE